APEGAVTKIARELVALARDVLHDRNLKEADEAEDLHEALGGDGVGAPDGGPAVGVGVEGVAGFVDVAAEVVSGTGPDVAQEGKLGDTAVLDLDVTEAVESLLVGLVEEAEGIEETDRGLDAELALEGVEGGGGLAGLGRGEGGGRGGEGGEDGKLHHG
ncbi:hypothetical protein ACHAWF_004671, partial [Thalassiosira exigua]